MNAVTSAVAAEWRKLHSVRSTLWFLVGALLLMLLVPALNAAGTADILRERGAAPGSVEAASEVRYTVVWVQFVLGALGMLAMTGEYATRSITVTLACTPSRTRLLLAKAAVVGAVVLVAGVLVAAVGVAASAPLLGEYADVDPVRIVGQVLAMGVYLALVAVLALGLGALIRRSAGTITVLFLLLLVVPELLKALATWLDARWLGTVADLTPSPAGYRLMDGQLGFGLVLVCWAVVAVAAGAWALRIRDV